MGWRQQPRNHLWLRNVKKEIRCVESRKSHTKNVSSNAHELAKQTQCQSDLAKKVKNLLQLSPEKVYWSWLASL